MDSRAPLAAPTPSVSPLGSAPRYRRLLVLIPWIALIHAASIVAVLGWLGARTGAPVHAAVIALGLASALFTMWRTGLAARYTPATPPDDDALPSITVVVPAFDEGATVAETLHTIAACDYPRDRLQIVAVDDGSHDDTHAWMLLAEAAIGPIVEVLRLPRNRGKREALAAGFEVATGDVLVTVDSDSFVRRDALRNLVAPLVRHPEVGAVAGNVRVAPRQTSLWSRLLDNAFTYSFEVVRAGQSVLGSVFCTPGAAAAYRRDLVLDVLPEWREETFLGRPAAIGEDRALTNRILAQGFHVTYQSTAVVETLVPDTLGAMRRMLLRWARSNVRESLVLLSFVFARFRRGPVAGVRLLAVQEAASLVLAGVGFVAAVATLAVRPVELVVATVAATVVAATVPALAFALLRGSVASAGWAVIDGLVRALVLPWLAPWALLTPHHSGWLTRGAAPRSAPDVAPRTVALESVGGG